jgi:hypothetical protein
MRLDLFRQLAPELVVLEERPEEEARVRRVGGEEVDDVVEPALEAHDGIAPGRERTDQASLDPRDDAGGDGRVELRLALEVVEERGLPEPDRLRDLGETDAGVPALGEELLGGVEDLVARALLGGGGGEAQGVGLLPTDRSVTLFRPVGCMSSTLAIGGLRRA